MSDIDRSAPVLVTGASGYVASWIVKLLLDEGRTVHATVRDPGKAASVAHLQSIAQNAPGQLKLFKAELLEAGSFDAAMQGCELVLHTASPFIISGIKDPDAELVKPAVEGTRNVLGSANRIAGVRRVVLTTSCAAIYGDNCDTLAAPGGVLTEAQWNTTSSLRHQPYSYSKVAAEQAAWEMAKVQTRWDLVCINPSLVMGPSLTRTSQSTSIATLVDLGSGKMRTGVPRLMFGVVDVRDVARAHLLAGFNPQAEGRHIVSACDMSLLDLARILRSRFPRYPFPRSEIPKFAAWLLGPLTAGITREFVSKNVGFPLRLDNSKSRRALGLEYRPIEATLTEHFKQLIDDGLVRSRG